MKKILLLILAIVLSGVLILSIPALNLLVKGDWDKKKVKNKTEVTVKKLDLNKKKEKKVKPKKRPNRSKKQNRNVKSGPRFAMDLGISGPGGVGLPLDMINQARGDGGGAVGDVDERPELNGGLNFKLPESIKKEEVDASVVLSFCVDQNGAVYNERVLEERPAGMGLGDAAKAALKSAKFSPAMLEGSPVAFCGMEQPIEVKYKD